VISDDAIHATVCIILAALFAAWCAGL